jgi:hypothetical protein
LFVKGSVKFEEVEEGKIQCGGCKEIFSRIVGHLTKSIDCTHNIDLEEFKSKWKKFSQMKRNAKCYQNQKKDNEALFLKNRSQKDKESPQKRKTLNEKEFLKEQA